MTGRVTKAGGKGTDATDGDVVTDKEMLADPLYELDAEEDVQADGDKEPRGVGVAVGQYVRNGEPLNDRAVDSD